MPGLQIVFAFFYSVFQGSARDTNLDNVRNRVVGILIGLLVTAFVFALKVTPLLWRTARIFPRLG